jgi:hypothetical protein
LSAKNEHPIHTQLSSFDEKDAAQTDGAAGSKKNFVEPEVSFPIDVLESTTFFQFTESGATN